MKKSRLLKDKIAVVTGGGRGIGKSVAEMLAREGAHVVICSRTSSELRKSCNEIRKRGHECDYFVVDVTKKGQVEDFVEQLVLSYGGVDFLINNAGTSHNPRFLEDLHYSEFEDTLRTNLFGTFYLTKNVLPHMKRRRRGMIVNISSSAGVRGRGMLSGYCASKSALIGFTQSVAEELLHFGVTCICLAPLGGFDTRLRAELFGRAVARKQKDPKIVADGLKDILTGGIVIPNGGVALVGREGVIPASNDRLNKILFS